MRLKIRQIFFDGRTYNRETKAGLNTAPRGEEDMKPDHAQRKDSDAL